MTKTRKCEECGAELAPEAPPGLCPACRIRSSDAHVQPTIAVTRAEARSSQAVEPLPESFDAAYRHPVGLGGDGGTWLAAFEPVFVRGRPETIRDTGWIVVVQERPR